MEGSCVATEGGWRRIKKAQRGEGRGRGYTVLTVPVGTVEAFHTLKNIELLLRYTN